MDKRIKTPDNFVIQETKANSRNQQDEVKQIKEENEVLKNENESLVKVIFQFQQYLIYISYRNILKISPEVLFTQKTFL